MCCVWFNIFVICRWQICLIEEIKNYQATPVSASDCCATCLCCLDLLLNIIRWMCRPSHQKRISYIWRRHSDHCKGTNLANALQLFSYPQPQEIVAYIFGDVLLFKFILSCCYRQLQNEYASETIKSYSHSIEFFSSKKIWISEVNRHCPWPRKIKIEKHLNRWARALRFWVSG